VLKTAI